MVERRGPPPWFGCDTSGEAWRAYCEAWSHAFENKDPRLKHLIVDQRGKAAWAAIEHNITVVRKDYAGEIADRTEIPRLLRL